MMISALTTLCTNNNIVLIEFTLQAVFVAHGSSFKRGYNTTEGFDNTEIYSLICGSNISSMEIELRIK